MKNHPRTHAIMKGQKLSCHKWAEGFEKELRQKYCSKCVVDSKGNKPCQGNGFALDCEIKEILGE